MLNANFILQAVINGILIGGVYSLVAVGLNLIFGVMKIVNFAHGALMMLGMYIAYWSVTLLSINPYLSILIVIPLMFALGAVIQNFLINPIIEAPEHNQLLLTLGVFLENLALFLWSPDYRVMATPLARINYYIGDLSISLVRVMAFGVSMICSAVLFLILTRTDLGKAIRGGKRGTGWGYPYGDQRSADRFLLLWHRRRLRRGGRRHDRPVLPGVSQCGRAVRDHCIRGGGTRRHGQLHGRVCRGADHRVRGERRRYLPARVDEVDRVVFHLHPHSAVQTGGAVRRGPSWLIGLRRPKRRISGDAFAGGPGSSWRRSLQGCMPCRPSPPK